MKKLLALLLACVLLCGCGAGNDAPPVTEDVYESRFDTETVIRLSEGGLDVTGPNSLKVFASGDIVYYEDRETYDSGNPYGEGEAWERHSMDEANSHLVINITAPGAYRVTGSLPAGQIRIDLGDDACDDPNAVVELILDNLDISCTVAPAILFQNVYECDGNWSTDTAKPDVDTSEAGANLILVGENTVSGSHVAKIFKDKKDEKKLWKQDGAIYSYMSMNVYGPGALDLTADNEGMDTELHMTINGGDITIRSDNDGINTNEDGVSVTTINGGNLRIMAGLGAEGDGIDSNGYLVINGGTVFSAANPASDAGLDSDLGSFINGGTVVALGSSMDWAESDSGQVTMNLQFASHREGAISVTREDGTEVFAFDPGQVFGEYQRRYQGAILSCPDFKQGESYHVCQNGAMMAYTGTDVMGRPGGMGGFRPDGQRGEGEMPTMPEGEMPTVPEGQEPPEGFGGQWPGGEMPTMPDGEMPTMPEGQEPPGGFGGDRGQMGGRGGHGGNPGNPGGEANIVFYMQDMVNFFSGLTESD